MHELSITESLLNTCLKEAYKRNIKKITGINIKTGIFSGIEPECIQIYLDMLSEGTIAEGAKLHSETIPVKLMCLDCKNEIETTRSLSECPACKSRRLKLISGNDFIIDSIEAETE